MERPHFNYVIYIASTPEKVWQALTTGEHHRHYWGGRHMESDWRPGSPLKLVRDGGEVEWEGEVLAAEAPRRLCFTVRFLADDELPEYEGESVGLEKHEPPSRVVIEISEYMGQTRLNLEHNGFEPGSRLYQGVSYSWPAVLSGLKTWLETGAVLFPHFP
ncbi:SRPBCC family protein [Gilvimarinus sp. F26214L]|uniref:SRPBCC family protein n=1 Tax=Gilvimarinus sp. DZF01 TaxID=3461371 RepID=UPI00404557FD